MITEKNPGKSEDMKRQGSVNESNSGKGYTADVQSIWRTTAQSFAQMTRDN